MIFSQKLRLISLLAAGSMSTIVFAQVKVNPSSIGVGPKLPPETISALKTPCTSVDIGISSIRIDKLEGGNYSATYEIRSFGPDAWRSSPGQAGSIITMASTRVANASSQDTPITLNGGTGASQTFTSPRVNYISRDSRSRSRDELIKHTLDIAITFDPDIHNDGNTCNDDAQVQNNSFYLGSKLDEFLYRSRERSKTFSFGDRQGPLPLSERTRPRPGMR